MINHLFTKIAQEELGIETLETRNSDSLDFHDVSVAGLTRAFQRAFNSGANSVVTEDYRDES